MSVTSRETHNATPIEGGSLGVGVPTTIIVNEGNDSMWWK
jgi:hypothetical protein